MKKLSTVWCILLLQLTAFAQHPKTFFTQQEAAAVKKSIALYPLLNQSYAAVKKDVDGWLGKDIDVPVPKDPAGGYTHDKHKANYTLMFNSGILYNLTGNEAYATLVKHMLLKYAALNPTLKNHPEATSSSPGHIFWQALNDANWMVYAGMAYDLIYNSLNAGERKQIEDGAFKPEVDFFTKGLKNWFNLLHNHAVWACAGVGIIGIATGNKDYVDMALYGTEKNGKSGFIAQMDNLFSPDGYYTEGPYYTRYAILPYMLFATALNNTNPALKIFEHRDSILLKALLTCMQQTNTNGSFFPLNDDLKDKDYTSNELVVAIDVAYKMYGGNEGLLTVAKKQNRVILNAGGVAVAKSIAGKKNLPDYFPYKTIESTDGAKGNEGGVTVLRNGKGNDLTSVVFKYASQGMGHGHFDRLNINVFDQGNEILLDYGSARFVGIEQKYGGRYLPENAKYATQTIAHNTITVDETSQFNGNVEQGSQYHAEKLFSSITNPAALAVAARENNAYKDVALQRNIYLLHLPEGKKLLVDIFNAASPNEHQYDLPFQYSGQFINTSFKYTADTQKQEPLGTGNGYQFIWKEAEATVKDTTIQFTFLNNNTYYTLSSLVQGEAQVFFTRTGANDPNFNLRRETACIIRKKSKNQTFLNVLEIHGNYDAVNEFSTHSYPQVQQMSLLRNDAEYTIAMITIAGKPLIIAQCNKEFGQSGKHAFSNGEIKLEWTGPGYILYNGKELQ
ncbi:MAG: alginate lyase family protein [Bacteroidetes bacterium]|nr:alginate lyase family protein [Bacteroidota bacterium]